MKKYIILILALAVPTLAAAVELFPSVDVTAQQRSEFYLALAHLTGYTEGDCSSPESETCVTDPALWVDNAAIAVHVRQAMVNQAKQVYRASKHRRAQAALPAQDSYSLGVE